MVELRDRSLDRVGGFGCIHIGARDHLIVVRSLTVQIALALLTHKQVLVLSFREGKGRVVTAPLSPCVSVGHW